MVDRAQLLVALPGRGHLVVGVAGVQGRVEACDRPVGQVLGAVPQQAADLVQGVVAVPAPVQGLLLDAAADLVHHLGTQLQTWNASKTATASPSPSRPALTYRRTGRGRRA